MKLKIWGDKDGTFHNFGNESENFSCAETVTISAYRAGGAGFQEKKFRTVVKDGQEDFIPAQLYFDVGPESK